MTQVTTLTQAIEESIGLVKETMEWCGFFTPYELAFQCLDWILDIKEMPIANKAAIATVLASGYFYRRPDAYKDGWIFQLPAEAECLRKYKAIKRDLMKRRIVVLTSIEGDRFEEVIFKWQ